MTPKEKQKQLLVEIMETDSKDGLYDLTAVEWLFDELKKHNLLVKPYTKGVNSLFEKAKQMEIRQTGLFMNWFIKHYSTATIDGMFGWVNAMNEEVTIKEILDDYYKK